VCFQKLLGEYLYRLATRPWQQNYLLPGTGSPSRSLARCLAVLASCVIHTHTCASAAAAFLEYLSILSPDTVLIPQASARGEGETSAPPQWSFSLSSFLAHLETGILLYDEMII